MWVGAHRAPLQTTFSNERNHSLAGRSEKSALLEFRPIGCEQRARRRRRTSSGLCEPVLLGQFHAVEIQAKRALSLQMKRDRCGSGPQESPLRRLTAYIGLRIHRYDPMDHWLKFPLDRLWRRSRLRSSRGQPCRRQLQYLQPRQSWLTPRLWPTDMLARN